MFEYRGVYYFDTFFTLYEQGDFQDQRRDNQALRDTLGVFLRASATSGHDVMPFLNERVGRFHRNSVGGER